MKKLSVLFALCLMPYALSATTVFSTSADWEAITGLRMAAFELRFARDRSIGGGFGKELYFLDGFPCFAQAEAVRAWVGPNARNESAVDTRRDTMMRIVCLYQPDTVKLAWRATGRNTGQMRTTGIMTCTPAPATGRNFSNNTLLIDLNDCVIGPEWNEKR